MARKNSLSVEKPLGFSGVDTNIEIEIDTFDIAQNLIFFTHLFIEHLLFLTQKKCNKL